MLIYNQPTIITPYQPTKFKQKISNNKGISTPINNTNLNNLNSVNRSLVNFTGYRATFKQTLEDNYFNLPTDKSTGKAFQPDIYQKAAAENLYKGNDVVVAAPTGTGKTAIAHYVIQKNLMEGKKTFYTAPLKALSNDKVREFQKIYGAENVGLLTGDRKVNKNAPIMIMTTEVYRNMLMQDAMENHNPMLKDLKTVVFDELHYLNDEDRGGVWEQSILFTKPKTQILALSGTMGNAGDITDWISSTKGHGTAEKVTPDDDYKALDTRNAHTVLINVPAENRHVPLDFQVVKLDHKTGKYDKKGSKPGMARKMSTKPPEEMQPTNADYIDMVYKLKKEDKLPAIMFVFSKRKSKDLLDEMKYNGPFLTTPQEAKQVRATIRDYKAQGKYLGELLDEEALERGYAIHNAGMLPEQKELIEKLFQEKLVKVALATETLSAGINMPARSTVITSLIKPVSRKVNEDGKRRLEPNEFHQMSGRAGRRGIDKRGYTYCMAVNNAQEKGFKKLIGEKANDIESHLNTDFSFVANVDKNFNSDEFLTNFYQKSLFAHDKDPRQKDLKTKALVEDFKVKEKILKDNAFITSSNKVTEKGELLAKLNGYEQIPVIDAIYNQDMKGMNPQQLAGYVAGLAMLSTEEQKGKGDSFVPYDDEYLAQKATNLLDRVDEYNEDVYPKLGQGQELHLNTDAMKHVFKWADLNSENEDSTENWHDMFKGDTGFKFKDEGSLFKEITMTTDLLKQINEIAEYAKEQTVNAPDKRYYSKLQETTADAIDLINRKPAKQDE